MPAAGLKARLRNSRDLRPPVSISEGELAEIGRRAQSNLLAAFLTRSGMAVALYAAIPGEVETGLIAGAVRDSGGSVYYPSLLSGEGMVFHRVETPGDLVPGPYGIPAPDGRKGSEGRETFDLIVVPGVAFDRLGNRLGRGAGYYDRFLARAVSREIVGLAYSWQIVPAVPNDPWDVRVGAVVTEDGVIRAAEDSRRPVL